MYSYNERWHALRPEKLRVTAEKHRLSGDLDQDDWGVLLPPENDRRIIKRVGSSNNEIVEVAFNNYDVIPNHKNGGFYGYESVGKNFREFLEYHPPVVDANSSLAGAIMANFAAYRGYIGWNPNYPYEGLKKTYEKFGVIPVVGAMQHMCQDNEIFLNTGINGLLKKIAVYKEKHSNEKDSFYDALTNVCLGLQNWILRNAEAAKEMYEKESIPEIRDNLKKIYEANYHIAFYPPRTFHEACQIILWFQLLLRTFNGSASIGRLDLQLQPFYERDIKANILTEEEAMFHVSCLLLRDTGYIQLGGYDIEGNDNTCGCSYMILEAIHRMGIPCNVGVAVGEGIDENLARRGMEIILEDKKGYPKFLGTKNTMDGFISNGFPVSDARARIYAGCHWLAIPGREFSNMDIIKINLARILEVSLDEMKKDLSSIWSVNELTSRIKKNISIVVDAISEGIDLQYDHMKDSYPELPLDLLSHGAIEKGGDVSSGTLEYYLFGVDACGVATLADSLSALREQIEIKRTVSWEQVFCALTTNWACDNGKVIRRILKNSPRFGEGNSIADAFAKEMIEAFSYEVTSRNTPKNNLRMLPGIFGWASIISMGKQTGATPNGRLAGEPISHGANPDPGFRKDGSPTALSAAVASIQPGVGNTAPLQLDIDPMISNENNAVNILFGLVKAHFDRGGTQINLNIVDKKKILEAYEDSSKYPDLIVRVTGFSAYFSTLSSEYKKIIIDRIMEGS